MKQVRCSTPRGRSAIARVVNRRTEAQFNTPPQDILTVDISGSRFVVPESEVVSV